MRETPDAPGPRVRLFSKANVARALNALLWAVFCAMSGTGLLLAFRMPPGSGKRLTALGLGRHDWGDWHTWLSYAFLALIAAHLALHWRWFWQVAAKKRPWPLLVGVGAGLALMAFLVFQPVSRGGGGGGGAGRGEGRGKQHASGRCDGVCEECRSPCQRE